MRIDRSELGRHYASLADEELLSIKRDDLTETALVIYDEEIAHRRLGQLLAAEEEIEENVQNLKGTNELLDTEHPEPEWLEDAVSACSFAISPGDSSVERASLAKAVLQTAGIPSHLTRIQEAAEGDGASAREIVNVMVPTRLVLHANSVLDRDLFNEEHETSWRSQLRDLSDSDLLTLDPKIFCAGVLDLAARMKKVYAEEMAKRKLKIRGV